jgi:hypothetical protein
MHKERKRNQKLGISRRSEAGARKQRTRGQRGGRGKIHGIDFLLDFVTSSLMKRIQMWEISKLGWLMGFVEHAIWADSLYFLNLLLLSTSKPGLDPT